MLLGFGTYANKGCLYTFIYLSLLIENFFFDAVFHKDRKVKIDGNLKGQWSVGQCAMFNDLSNVFAMLLPHAPESS